MVIETNLISSWEEHAFWLEILGDHAHFVRDHLSSIEHHLPETCYFIKKLSNYVRELANQATKCPLAKPSFT